MSVVRGATLATLLLLLTAGAVLAFTWRPGTVATEADNTIRTLVTDEHNRHCSTGLGWDAPLVWAARYKVMDMAYRGYFSHTDPLGKHIYNFYPRAGVSYHYAAEILATNSYSDDTAAAAAFKAWMNSSTHRAVIQSCTYTRYGVGTFKIANGTKYFAVEFTRP